LEILAVPLLHSAYLTSAVFGIANALLRRDRIRREEQALEEDYSHLPTQARPGHANQICDFQNIFSGWR